MRHWLWLLLVGAAMAGCETATDPSGRKAPDPDLATASSGQDLTFVRFTSSTPPATRDTSFWAVKGKDRRLIIHYQGPTSGERGDKLLEFRVRPESLLRRPNGRRFTHGDSVRISVRIDGSDRFVFTFEPAGLKFNPERPAELEIEYDHADPDLNNDGRVDGDDDRCESLLKVWRQEAGQTTWNPITTSVETTDDRVRARVRGFTSFALASN